MTFSATPLHLRQEKPRQNRTKRSCSTCRGPAHKQFPSELRPWRQQHPGYWERSTWRDASIQFFYPKTRSSAHMIGPVGCDALAKALHSNSSLQDLQLANNLIGSQGTQALSVALHNNSGLQNLNLSSNQLGYHQKTKCTFVKLRTPGDTVFLLKTLRLEVLSSFFCHLKHMLE